MKMKKIFELIGKKLYVGDLKLRLHIAEMTLGEGEYNESFLLGNFIKHEALGITQEGFRYLGEILERMHEKGFSDKASANSLFILMNDVCLWKYLMKNEQYHVYENQAEVFYKNFLSFAKDDIIFSMNLFYSMSQMEGIYRFDFKELLSMIKNNLDNLNSLSFDQKGYILKKAVILANKEKEYSPDFIEISKDIFSSVVESSDFSSFGIYYTSLALDSLEKLRIGKRKDISFFRKTSKGTLDISEYDSKKIKEILLATFLSEESYSFKKMIERSFEYFQKSIEEKSTDEDFLGFLIENLNKKIEKERNTLSIGDNMNYSFLHYIYSKFESFSDELKMEIFNLTGYKKIEMNHVKGYHRINTPVVNNDNYFFICGFDIFMGNHLKISESLVIEIIENDFFPKVTKKYLINEFLKSSENKELLIYLKKLRGKTGDFSLQEATNLIKQGIINPKDLLDMNTDTSVKELFYEYLCNESKGEELLELTEFIIEKNLIISSQLFGDSFYFNHGNSMGNGNDNYYKNIDSNLKKNLFSLIKEDEKLSKRAFFALSSIIFAVCPIVYDEFIFSIISNDQILENLKISNDEKIEIAKRLMISNKGMISKNKLENIILTKEEIEKREKEKEKKKIIEEIRKGNSWGMKNFMREYKDKKEEAKKIIEENKEIFKDVTNKKNYGKYDYYDLVNSLGFLFEIGVLSKDEVIEKLFKSKEEK